MIEALVLALLLQAAPPPAIDEVPVPAEADPPFMAPLPVPEPPPAPEGMKVAILAGGLVSMSSETEGGKVAPLARIAVSGPLALPGIEARHLPRMFVSADFTALPGDTIDLRSPETFKALELRLGVAQRVAPELAAGDQRIVTQLYAAAGFATRLSGENEPRDRAPRFGEIGVRLEERTSGSFIAVGLAADQRLDGRYQPAVVIGGAVQLYEVDSGTLRGARALLVGNAILGLDLSYVTGRTPARRDQVRVGIAIGH